MQYGRVRRLILLLVLATACGEDSHEVGSDLDRAAEYLDSAAYRRDVLETSLANPDNGYSKRRLEHYTEDGWGALDEWNPRVRPFLTSDVAVPVPDDTWTRLTVERRLDDASLQALGQAAFTTYPSKVDPALVVALEDPESFGLWVANGRVGGLVWVELPDGVQPAFTCSSCHTQVDPDGTLVYGAPNHDFDYGALLDSKRGGATESGRWGPGRVDVTPDDIENATVIADLRAVRFQERLNRAATIINDVLALTVRLETAVITASNQAIRPPREVALGLAWYLWSLGDTLASPQPGPGMDVFDRECGECHRGDALSGPPTPLDVVGTDPTVGQSPWRETGAMQTPSLRGVARRGRLTAGGHFDSLEAMLDPEREAQGHRFGLELPPSERNSLLEFLGRLDSIAVYLRTNNPRASS